MLSPQDKVERVLKEIHICFSESPSLKNQPDKMVIDRRQFLRLLDRLNKGIYDLMDQYEGTRQSRMNAERAFKKKSDEIIEQATANANDIYAASVIYTEDAIGKIRDLMDQTNDSMNDLFRMFRKELRDQKDILRAHETELQSQLTTLADTQKYLDIIREMNREREKANRDLQAAKEAEQSEKTSTETAPAGNVPKETAPARPARPAADLDIKINPEYFEKTGKPLPGTKEAEPEVKPVEAAPEVAAVEDEIVETQLPDEETIRRAVLEDERQEALRQMEEEAAQKGRDIPSAGHILKTIIFGKE